VENLFHSFFILLSIIKKGDLRNEKFNRFYSHILTGDDAKVGEIGVHLLLDDG
jgi:hypothetical protein